MFPTTIKRFKSRSDSKSVLKDTHQKPHCSLWLNARRGSIVTSRLASYYPQRFVAFAFLAGGYYPLLVGFDVGAALAFNKQNFQSELFGYWL